MTAKEPTSQHPVIVVCRGPHCRERGSAPLRARLAAIARRRQDVQVVGYACFGQCERGPNVAFFPDAEWFGGLANPAVAESLFRHATGEKRLVEMPLDLPPHEKAEHERNVYDLLRTLERDRQHRWWWPF